MQKSLRDAATQKKDHAARQAADEGSPPARTTEPGAADATGAVDRPDTWRGRLLWAGSIILAAVALFIGLWRIARFYPVNSDGAGMGLMGWDMLHGNLLLHGWWTSDVSFYTFEIPLDAIVGAVRGLNASVVQIAAAIAYALLVCVGALAARGNSRGRAGIAAALLAGGILLAPGDTSSAGILVGSPDHIGVAVPILIAFLFLDRARERWWVPPVLCVLLVWAQLDDPMAEFSAAFAIAVVCLGRAALGLLRRAGRAWVYDAAVGVAAVVSYGLTRLAVGLIRSMGGFSMRQLQQATQFQPLSHWPHQLKETAYNTLILFGADFTRQPSGLYTAGALLHLAGAALAACGVLAGIVALVRRGDRVTQALTVGTLVTLAAGAFATAMAPGYDAHEIAVVLPFSAVLAGRTIGPWLVRRRLARRTLAPVGGAVLAAYVAFFGFFAAQTPAVPARTSPLADFLVAHHLTDGIGQYWVSSATRIVTGGQVRISPMGPDPKRPYPWITHLSWYNAGAHTANFVVAGPDPGSRQVFGESAVVKAFGQPVREYRFDQYIIMVYDKNLLREAKEPVQPHPDMGGFHL